MQRGSRYPKCRSDELVQLDTAVRTWIANANRSYAIPQSERRITFAAALETARNIHPARHWEMLSHLL